MSAVVKWVFEDYWQGQEATSTFPFTGYRQTFVVPDTTEVVVITARGGCGGGQSGQRSPGGYVSGMLGVTPGEELYVRVGGRGGLPVGVTPGPGGYNGGAHGGSSPSYTPGIIDAGCGGGGATDLRQGGDALTDRKVVAGGGGGRSGFPLKQKGGAGGGLIGGSTWTTRAPDGGKGGTQTAGGGGGSSGPTYIGALGVGGLGKNNPSGGGCGGGGAGYYGGGGGGVDPVHPSKAYGPGGGGSSYVGGMSIIDDGRNLFSNGLINVQGDPGDTNVQEGSLTIQYSEIADKYTWAINPNDGGSVAIQKNMLVAQNSGPNRVNIVQEGVNQAPVIAFSGTILAQEHLEQLEYWFDRRVLIKLSDDLGREFYGVFSQFTPKRLRRASNFWYHTYDAQFTISAYKNASGNWVYGRIL